MFQPITTRRLSLRTLHPSDAPPIFAYRSKPEVSRYQNWEPTRLEQVEDFIESVATVEAPEPGKWLQLAICLRNTGDLIGDCGIHLAPDDARQAELGITLNPVFHKQGFAGECLQAVLHYLFSQVHMHRVTGSVDPRNLSSIALLRRVGMRQEAHHRESYWSKGEWMDDVIFALLDREWALSTCNSDPPANRTFP